MRTTFFDRPLPKLFQRTPRELAIVGIGVFGVVYGLADPHCYGVSWVAVFGVAALLFAVRFWPARPVALGACLASIAQCAVVRTPRDWPWALAAAIGAVVLLSSRDLAARFEEAPESPRFFPNAWASLPRADARRLRFSAYALAVLAAVLMQAWLMGARGFPWSPVVVAVLGVAIALLALARAAVLLVVTGLALAIAIAVMPSIVGAGATIEGFRLDSSTPDAHVVAGLACAAAAVAFALAAPYAVRLIRRV
jgi:hypothetical protein